MKFRLRKVLGYDTIYNLQARIFFFWRVIGTVAESEKDKAIKKATQMADEYINPTIEFEITRIKGAIK